MKFRAYSSKSTSFSGHSRDESAGIIGTMYTSKPPIGKSNTREDITEIAYAFLGRYPEETVYITDTQDRVLDFVRNEKYHKDLETQATWHFMAWTLLFLCVVCFLSTLVCELQWGGFGLFFLIAVFYVASVRLGINNEVESAVLCTIVLFLILILVPAIKKARGSFQTPPAAESSQVLAPRIGCVEGFSDELNVFRDYVLMFVQEVT